MATSPTVYDPLPPGKKVIFRVTRVDPKTGKLLDARWYGLKAWRIVVDDDDSAN
jgi:hypothetical protein